MDEEEDKKNLDDIGELLEVSEQRKTEIENSVKEAIKNAGKPLKPYKALSAFFEQEEKKCTKAELLYAGMALEYHVHNIVMIETSLRTEQSPEEIDIFLALASWYPAEDDLKNGIAG